MEMLNHELEQRVKRLEAKVKDIATIPYCSENGRVEISLHSLLYQLLDHLKLGIFRTPPKTNLRKL